MCYPARKACSNWPVSTKPTPSHASENEFETIVRRLNVQLGQARQHVGTHVREYDPLAVELRPMLHQRCIVEVKGNPLLVEVSLADEEIP